MDMSLDKRTLIIIPTYNENENIKKIISIIREIRSKTEVTLEVLVVDDSSPDNLGTTLESPLIDVSSLTTPALSFFLISNNTQCF